MCDFVSAYRQSLTCPLTCFAVLQDSVNNPRLFMGGTAYFRGRIDEKVRCQPMDLPFAKHQKKSEVRLIV